MPRSIGQMITDSLALSLGHAERLLAGIPDRRFGRFAAPGGVVVESNHPAFVYGHLSLYGARILEQLGADATAIQPSETFQKLFSKEAKCVDDPDEMIYPAAAEIKDLFSRGYVAAKEVLLATSDAAFQQPNPIPGRMSELFPTLGSLQAFYAGGHLMMHLGQISAWRRMEGMGPA